MSRNVKNVKKCQEMSKNAEILSMRQNFAQKLNKLKLCHIRKSKNFVRCCLDVIMTSLSWDVYVIFSIFCIKNALKVILMTKITFWPNILYFIFKGNFMRISNLVLKTLSDVSLSYSWQYWNILWFHKRIWQTLEFEHLT